VAEAGTPRRTLPGTTSSPFRRSAPSSRPPCAIGRNIRHQHNGHVPLGQSRRERPWQPLGTGDHQSHPRLLIIAWLALLGWGIHTIYISEIITWIILTLIGWRLRPLARRLWWRYGWHWPLPPAPPPEPLPPFRICYGKAYGDWITDPRQVATMVLALPAAARAAAGSALWHFDGILQGSAA